MKNKTFLPKSSKNICYIILLVMILMAFVALFVYGVGWGGWFDIVLGVLGMLLVPFEMYGVLASKIVFTENNIKYFCGNFSRYVPNGKLIGEIEYQNIESYDYTNTKKQLVMLRLKDATAILCLKQYSAAQITAILGLLDEILEAQKSAQQEVDTVQNQRKVAKNTKKTQKNAKKH